MYVIQTLYTRPYTSLSISRQEEFIKYWALSVISINRHHPDKVVLVTDSLGSKLAKLLKLPYVDILILFDNIPDNYWFLSKIKTYESILYNPSMVKYQDFIHADLDVIIDRPLPSDPIVVESLEYKVDAGNNALLCNHVHNIQKHYSLILPTSPLHTKYSVCTALFRCTSRDVLSNYVYMIHEYFKLYQNDYLKLNKEEAYKLTCYFEQAYLGDLIYGLDITTVVNETYYSNLSYYSIMSESLQLEYNTMYPNNSDNLDTGAEQLMKYTQTGYCHLKDTKYNKSVINMVDTVLHKCYLGGFLTVKHHITFNTSDLLC